ncbi:hypothetical protein QP444_07205 [Winkia sp. UMB1185]|nr:hypothetical protein [Winkia sp. UMB1185]MDK7229063.1 hypothetical protein [Winkia sp. UMB1185]
MAILLALSRQFARGMGVVALLALTVPSSLSALAAPEGDKVGDLIPAPT